MRTSDGSSGIFSSFERARAFKFEHRASSSMLAILTSSFERASSMLELLHINNCYTLIVRQSVHMQNLDPIVPYVMCETKNNSKTKAFVFCIGKKIKIKSKNVKFFGHFLHVLHKSQKLGKLEKLVEH